MIKFAIKTLILLIISVMFTFVTLTAFAADCTYTSSKGTSHSTPSAAASASCSGASLGNPSYSSGYVKYAYSCPNGGGGFVSSTCKQGGAGGDWGDTTGGNYTGGGGGFGSGGAGGSWGNDGGFGGNGGSDGTDVNTICTGSAGGNGPVFTEPTISAVCSKISQYYVGVFNKPVPFSVSGNKCVFDGFADNFWNNRLVACNEDPNPTKCPQGQHFDGYKCVNDLKCPQGYKKEGDKCVWQCPQGFKMLGGSCVKDDQPEDCDPSIQECDEDGKPKCNICEKLSSIINNQFTQINNENRIISLNETMVANQNTTNNILSSVNNEVSNVNNNLNVINNNMQTMNNNIINKFDELINIINEKNPDFDTTEIENKLDLLLQKEFKADVNLDEVLAKLDLIIQAIKDNKYDDTELRNQLDTLFNDLALKLDDIEFAIEDNTGVLVQIKKILQSWNTKEADLAPDLDNDPFDASLDPWSAIRGFDINQNLIDAQEQCPPAENYSFDIFGTHFVLPIYVLCDAFAKLGPAILFLAYMGSAFIIVKGD